MKLRCKDLEASYSRNGSRECILHKISVETRSGEFLSVLGPSGCGKTTFLRTLIGAVRPDAGRVDLIPTCPGESGQPLLVQQENSLFPWLTALDNACFGLAMRGIAKDVREARALELFERYDLYGRQNAYPHELSLGMKQRVALIRAFLCNPPLMLMDEPFAALDAQTRLILQQELISLWETRKDSGVIFVTHDVDEALLLSDRVVILSGRPATVVAELVVDLPRPRLMASTLTPEFIDLKARILRYLGVNVDAFQPV